MSHNIPAPKPRALYLSAQVDQVSMGMISTAILDINQNDEYIAKMAEIHGMTYNPKPIVLHIDSYGGYVYQCFGLLSVMKNSKVPVHTIVTGCAMSCGFLIAITGHERYAYEKATFMYHQVSGGTHGKVKEVEEDLIEAKRLQKMIEDHTIANTGLTRKQLKENYDAKHDWFMNTKEALKYKVIDTII
jgi:ATP-dependent Clp protease protease subunit